MGDMGTVLEGLHCMSPNSPSFLEGTGLLRLADTLMVDKEQLQHDIRTCKSLLANLKKHNDNYEYPKNLSDLIRCLSPYEQAIQVLYNMCIQCISLPIGTASCERSFSVLRRVKNYLRNSMTDSSLNSLALMVAHKQDLEDISSSDVVETFKARGNLTINL